MDYLQGLLFEGKYQVGEKIRNRAEAETFLINDIKNPDHNLQIKFTKNAEEIVGLKAINDSVKRTDHYHIQKIISSGNIGDMSYFICHRYEKSLDQYLDKKE